MNVHQLIALSAAGVFDSAMLSIKERVKYGKELSAAIKERNAATSAVAKLKISKVVQELRKLLGMIPTPPQAEPVSNPDLSDKSTDENYRWKDTAYIAGARKEMAQKAIMDAKREGKRLNVNDIDWEDLRQDPRMAEKMITRENVFGRVDWKALADDGMPSRVGYFISRIYANTDKQPIHPLNTESQENFVKAFSNLRDLLEPCRDFNDVIKVMNDIVRTYSAHQSALYQIYERQNKDGGSFDEVAASMYGERTERYLGRAMNYDGRVWAELGVKFASWVKKSVNSTLKSARRDARPAAWENWCSGFDSGTSTDADGTPASSDEPKKPRTPSFQLEAAQDIERVGGREVTLESSQQLQDMFGLKGIQSGNWVLKDKAAAEFHMKNAAAAMLDMSDVLGIDPKHLGLNGNLALAFGARGKKGALAHYEPSTKVINITKMKGGGSLGHEYFHALDNLIKDLSTQTVGSAGFMGTSNPNDLPDVDLAAAFKALRGAMHTHKGVLTFKYPEMMFPDGGPDYSTRSLIQRTAENALRSSRLSITAPMNDLMKWVEAQSKVTPSQEKFKSNVAYVMLHRFWVLGSESGVNISGGVLTLDGVPMKSQFYQNAIELDQGKDGKYWSKDYEMAARAFSAYLQDRLAEQGRKNDYLAYSTQGGNGRVGEVAYPQGEERHQINAAFDGLFKTIRDKKVLENASENKALMDGLFGNAKEENE